MAFAFACGGFSFCGSIQFQMARLCGLTMNTALLMANGRLCGEANLQRVSDHFFEGSMSAFLVCCCRAPARGAGLGRWRSQASYMRVTSEKAHSGWACGVTMPSLLLATRRCMRSSRSTASWTLDGGEPIWHQNLLHDYCLHHHHLLIRFHALQPVPDRPCLFAWQHNIGCSPCIRSLSVWDQINHASRTSVCLGSGCSGPWTAFGAFSRKSRQPCCSPHPEAGWFLVQQLTCFI